MKRKDERKQSSSAGLGVDRRTFVKLLPAVGVAGFASTRIDASSPDVAESQQQQPQSTQRVTKEMLHAAEQLIGIELTDAQEAMALPGVNRALTGYETLRKIEVPLDTEPATVFHPALPGKKYNGRPAAKFKIGKQDIPKYNSLEEAAFFKATQLAELIRTKQISSVDLTKMYLARLKRYGPKLLCVVTLTEDLALKQASEADREIKAGKYRSPLHGIPCGIKDLFATKGIKTTWGAEPYRDQMIDYDSTVVERLRDAGAVLVAKLSMGALAQGGRWFAGMTRNRGRWKKIDSVRAGRPRDLLRRPRRGLSGSRSGLKHLAQLFRLRLAAALRDCVRRMAESHDMARWR